MTGSVIGPGGFYLAAMTADVSDIFFFFPSRRRRLLLHGRQKWPFRAHYFYEMFQLSCTLGEKTGGGGVRFVHSLSLIISQTFFFFFF